ncbi:MAG: hypothetical protein R3B48_00315 [Kofleriaceae bacterium]
MIATATSVAINVHDHDHHDDYVRGGTWTTAWSGDAEVDATLDAPILGEHLVDTGRAMRKGRPLTRAAASAA